MFRIKLGLSNSCCEIYRTYQKCKKKGIALHLVTVIVQGKIFFQFKIRRCRIHKPTLPCSFSSTLTSIAHIL